MCRLRSDGRSNALPHTWHGRSGRWRAGRPVDEEAPARALLTAPASVAAPRIEWRSDEMSSVSVLASRPDALLDATSSPPDDRPADWSLDTDWRPSEAPAFELAACWCWSSWAADGGGDEHDDDDVSSESDRSSGLSVLFVIENLKNAPFFNTLYKKVYIASYYIH